MAEGRGPPSFEHGKQKPKGRKLNPYSAPKAVTKPDVFRAPTIGRALHGDFQGRWLNPYSAPKAVTKPDVFSAPTTGKALQAAAKLRHGELLELDFKDDLMSSCMAVACRLKNVNEAYKDVPPTEYQIKREIDIRLDSLKWAIAFQDGDIDGDPIDGGLFRTAVDNLKQSLGQCWNASYIVDVQMLETTMKQLKNRHIFISFFGTQNCGKSTLLNALLGAKFLPTKDVSETGLKVSIQHNQHLQKMTHTPAAETEPYKECPYLCEKLSGKVKQTEGDKPICERLRQLNKDARDRKVEVPECTLHVNLPALSEIPQGWSVSLADNPGFGEANEHIAQLASASVHDSSAYVYVTNSENAGSRTDFQFFEKLAKCDEGSLSNGRLSIAITKIDRSRNSANQDESASVDEIKSKVCDSVMEATQFRFPQNEVIPVSGLCGLHANHLHSAIPEKAKIQARNVAALELSLWPELKLPCGQEENVMASLHHLSSEYMAEQLDKVSGIHILERRIQSLARGCVGIWAKKVVGDYCRYLEDAAARLSERVTNTAKLIREQLDDKEKSSRDYEELMGDYRRWKSTFVDGPNSAVYKAIEQAYEKDLLFPEPQAKRKSILKEHLKSFEMKCRRKIPGTKKYGRKQFEQDLTQFLDDTEASLEDTFHESSVLRAISDVVIREKLNVTEGMSCLRSNSAKLCKEEKGMKATNLEDSLRTRGIEELPKPAPNLGVVKKKVNLQSIRLPLSVRYVRSFKGLFRGSPDKFFETHYSDWKRYLDEIKESLLEKMCEESDIYFKTIKPTVVEFFFEDYCKSAKRRMDAYNHEFKELIRRENVRQKLVEVVGEYLVTMEDEMRRLCVHLPKLKERLGKQAEEYISRST